MLTEPQIVTKQDQPYAAILLTLAQPEISQKAPPLIEDVIAWIKAHGGKTTGAPFFNYVTFFPDGKMQMQVGMPTDTVLKADGTVSTGTLPGGKYASLTATAPYHELHDANMKLHDWTVTKGHKLDGTEDGDRFIDANRMEIYHKDPGEDPSGHPVTEIAFRLAQ
jgi:effector-binding domain-containing protein